MRRTTVLSESHLKPKKVRINVLHSSSRKDICSIMSLITEEEEHYMGVLMDIPYAEEQRHPVVKLNDCLFSTVKKLNTTDYHHYLKLWNQESKSKLENTKNLPKLNQVRFPSSDVTVLQSSGGLDLT